MYFVEKLIGTNVWKTVEAQATEQAARKLYDRYVGANPHILFRVVLDDRVIVQSSTINQFG